MASETSTGGRTLIGERVGSYRIEREIARGGMGVVYEAVHERLGQRAAVKVLTDELAQDPNYPEYVSRFLDEARAVTVIGHPGIVHIHDQGQLPDGTVYILMEYLAGESLYQRVWRQVNEVRSGLALPDGLRFARQIASAIAAAHQKGILHRDLKLANVLLVADPEAPGAERTKLIDFGLARFLDTPHRRTTAGTILGTPAYMSPEQCMGRDVDQKADVYALGVMLYEMLTGHPPFDGSMAAVLFAQISDEPASLREQRRDVPDGVHYLVHSLLAKDPAARPTMEQVVSRLQQLEAEQAKRSATQPVLDDDATRLMPEMLAPTPSMLAGVAPKLAPAKAPPPEPASTRISSPAVVRPRPRLLIYAGAGGALAALLLLLLWLVGR